MSLEGLFLKGFKYFQVTKKLNPVFFLGQSKVFQGYPEQTWLGLGWFGLVWFGFNCMANLKKKEKNVFV